MKKYLKLSTGLFILFLLCCVLWVLQINSSVNEIGIEGNKVHFKAPVIMIFMINGKPDEIIEYSETRTKEYIYHDQMLFGQKGSISYSCLSGVYQVEALIPVTEQDGEKVFNYVSEYMSSVYSQKKGFYEDEIMKDSEKQTISKKLGANLGATGITVAIELIDNRIKITANYQY
ncbi:MAG: hypothetical protein ACI4ED_08925 [Suilimivivens sp.]